MQPNHRRVLQHFKQLNVNAGCDPQIVDLCLVYLRDCLARNIRADFNNILPSISEMFEDSRLSLQQVTCLKRLAQQSELFLQRENVPENFTHLHLWYCYRLLLNGVAILFTPSDLAERTGVSIRAINFLATDAPETYVDFDVPKRGHRGVREISAPIPKLRQTQRWILDNILCNVQLSNHATAYIVGKSIQNNALPHVQSKIIINFDLKDFFPSVSFQRVLGVYLNLGYVYPVALLLTKLSCHNERIPQGSPTSPAICNILCRKLDRRLGGLAHKLGFQYTRYADDITFSGERFIDGMINSVKKIVNDEGFQLNDRKTKVIRAGKSQKVTGLVVNQRVNIPRPYYRRIRAMIHNCLRFGPNSQTAQELSAFKAQLYGHAHYVNSINPEKGKILLEQLDQVSW